MKRLPEHSTVPIRERLLNRSRNKDRELAPAEQIQLRIKSMNERTGGGVTRKQETWREALIH